MQDRKTGGFIEYSYHPELIALYNSGVRTGVIIGNTISPLLVTFILFPYIPIAFLLTLLFFAAMVSIFRLWLVQKIVQQQFQNIGKYVNLTIVSTGLSGSFWGALSVLTLLFAPSLYIYFIATIIVGLTAAASASLSTIFKSYVAYTTLAMTPLILGLFILGERLFTVSAILILFFMVFVLIGGHRHYKKLHEAIILKDRLKRLNENLEDEVKIRTKELEELNDTLEDKTSSEIEKNRAKDQQLLQQSRMAQMGEMISMIAHQWRQPLSAIAAASIDLKMKLAFSSFDLNKKEQQEACGVYFDEQLNNIENYVQSLTTTIDDFRNFYKPGKEQKSLTINIPIQKSLGIIEASAISDGITIVDTYDSEKELALFDSELMQVFLNILKNAQDNFKEKKTENPRIMIHTKDTQEGVCVEIIDNGGGIPEEIQKKIFDPYFSTKEEKDGTGLGLYMSKIIVEEHHHGKLTVNNKDNGVIFKIDIVEKG